MLMDGWRGRRIINSPSLIADYHRLGVCPTWWLAGDVSVITALKILITKGLALDNMIWMEAPCYFPEPLTSLIVFCFQVAVRPILILFGT